MKTASKHLKVEKSSGNVFADIDLNEPCALLAKAQLAERICRIISARRLTQKKAGEIMELGQPRISALMRGKLHEFSTERLFRCLNDLGQEIEIIVRPARGSGRRGHVQVV